MAWFSLAKIALQAGSKIYANKQRTKMAMSDAQLMHAEKMARGEEAYQGKLLEARQNYYKDEFVHIIITTTAFCDFVMMFVCFIMACVFFCDVVVRLYRTIRFQCYLILVFRF